MSKYYHKRLSNKEEYLISLKCSKCKNVWNSLEPDDGKMKICPSCQTEQKLITELNKNTKLRYLETLYDIDKNIMIFKTHTKRNISIHISDDIGYIVFTDKSPINLNTINEVVNFLS